jgi:hypothetical protein
MTSVNLWNQTNIPHKNWYCVDVIDNKTPNATCEMCGNECVRYVHVMSHPEHQGYLNVGCVCAEKMENDYVNPRKRERKLRNAAARIVRQKKRAAENREKNISLVQNANWALSQSGNYYLNVLGIKYSCHIVVVKSKFGNFWAIGTNGKFSSYKYSSREDAMRAAKLIEIDKLTKEKN